jgi:MoxR-like ATPase
VWDPDRRVFEFRPGPVFANVVVADEINRASPKTQSALLEVMEEAQVTVDGQPHRVPAPFLVIATQNPIDLEGTYRLPEAQLDRFLMRITVGHPSVDVEEQILTGRSRAALPVLPAVTSPEQIGQLQRMVSTIHTAPEIARYIALVADATRTHAALRLGVSTRGSLALLRAAQAHAACAGRHFVIPDDVKTTAAAVLTHRLVLAAQAEVRGVTAAAVLAEVLAGVRIPALVTTPAR